MMQKVKTGKWHEQQVQQPSSSAETLMMFRESWQRWLRQPDDDMVHWCNWYHAAMMAQR